MSASIWQCRKHILAFVSLLFFSGLLHIDAQYSGLRFYGHDVPLDQRTSLNLSPEKPLDVGDEFEFSFVLKLDSSPPDGRMLNSA